MYNTSKISDRLSLKIKVNNVNIEDEVFDFFRGHNRINKLFNNIYIYDEEYCIDNSDNYTDELIKRIDELNNKIIFLDPDTGISPEKTTSNHVKQTDILKIWKKLISKDILCIFQHGRRNKSWKEDTKYKIGKLLNIDYNLINIIDSESVKDVALYYMIK
jgi:hypothetical protein